MTRKVLAVTVGLLSAAGLAAVSWFLLSQPIEAADKWASLLGGTVAYVALVGGVVVYLTRRAWQQPVPEIAAEPVASGDVVSAAAVGGPVVFGNQNPVAQRTEQIRQLPLDPVVLVGRDAAVEAVRQVVDGPDRPRIINIHGMPGVGKTALAVHVARHLLPETADRLFLDLRDSSVEDALGSALIALGAVPAELVAGTGARSAHYRTLLASRLRIRAGGIVIVIDNAAPDGDLRHLLSGDPEAVVIVASWAPLSDLQQVVLIPLAALTDTDAVTMLMEASGRRSSDGAGDVARRVGNVPMALEICAGLAKQDPDRSWAAIAAGLTDRTGTVRTYVLEAGTSSMRTSLAYAYADLDIDAARAYRRLGRAPRPEFPASLAAALVAPDDDSADLLIARLRVRRLLTTDGDRYRMHGILWSHARQLAAADRESLASDERLIGWTLRQLRDVYLPRLGEAVRPVLLLSRWRTPTTDLDTVYIDAPVRAAGRTTTLAKAVKKHPRLVLTGVGGSGKTTMLHRLCADATHGASRLPLLMYARDLHSAGPDLTIEGFVLDSLRVRYNLDLLPEPLPQALIRGNVLVIVDAIDEVAGSHRQRLTAAIGRFASAHADIPILVTSRPYTGLGTEFAGFTVADLPAWPPRLIARYADVLRRVTRRSPATVTGSSLLGAFGTPLLQQMAATVDGDEAGQGATDLLGHVVDDLLFSRELGRVWSRYEPAKVRRLLEAVGATMQMSSSRRSTVTLADVLALTEARGFRNHDVESLVRQLAAVQTILVGLAGERDEPLYAFAHTGFREYLAASYFARQPVADLAVVIVERHGDPTWQQVLRMAVGLLPPGEDRERLDKAVGRRRRGSTAEALLNL